MLVIKRDGREVPFDKEKIKAAVIGAFSDVDGVASEYAKDKAREIANHIEAFNRNMTVEEIQDEVEHKLMGSNRKDVARQYIVYRDERTRARERNTKFMKTIMEKVSASNIQHQNANVDEASFGGRKGEADSELMRKIALDELMSPMAKANHLNNEIYVHDLDSYAVGMHNCFERHTRFITDEGIKSFADFNDGSLIKVLNKNGEWASATVHMYGRQPMQEVVLERSGKRLMFVCTPNHRWILTDGSVTDKLSEGDSLYLLKDSTSNFDIDTKRKAEMFCLGFVLGDGVDHGNYIEARLCGDKAGYADFFRMANYSVSVWSDGDVHVRKRPTVSKQEFLNNKLWRVLSLEDKIAIFNGYYAADGSHTTSTNHIWTSDDRIKDMIFDISALAGYHVFSFKEVTRDTNYKANAILYSFTFTTCFSTNTAWKVVSIRRGEHRNPDYEAWCVDEPLTHSFTLEGGVVTGNCLSIPFDDLLTNGFNTRQTDVRPAQSVNTAFQLVAVLFQLQSLQQFGGVSATHIDWTMVPYVRKSLYKHYLTEYLKGTEEFYALNLEEMEEEDLENWEDEHKREYLKKMGLKESDFYIGSSKLDKKLYQAALYETRKETYQAVEGMYHNLNTLQSRSGNQLPFTSINYGTCTLPEGRMITKALLNVSIKGIGKLHKTPIFPCGIFQVMKGVNREPGDPNYDLYRLALESTSKRLYPNYANVDWSVNTGYDKNDPKTYFSTMGCRTSNGADINADPSVNPQTKDGRGNICPVTIIMPTLAMEADRDVEKFMSLLDQKIHEAKDMLIERYEWICSQSPDSAKFMYENGTMLGYKPEEGIRSALKHGTIVIGQLGLAETLQLLIGCNHTKPEGMELAKRIEQLFKDRCAKFKKEYHLNFGVYYTPAENLCYTAMKKFRNKYGVIPNVSDREYFTNSMHVPVWEDVTPFEKIDIESQLTGYSNAGCITYVELPWSARNNIDALETIVNYAMDHDIPYFAVNVPNDTCLDCGYTGEFNDTCPQCGSHNIQQLRRVTGYLTGDYTTAFNKGKQAEVNDRIKHAK